LNATEFLFVVSVIILVCMLAAVVWSVAFPARRFWPPPGKRSFQYWLTWIAFWLVSAINLALLFLDWNSWHYQSDLRLIVGIPLALIGLILACWGIGSLGISNTSGLKDGIVASGPYRFTRNPQYVGDILIYVGLSVVANSLYLWICHALLMMVFVITPLAEEIWLEEQYGTTYLEYKKQAPRFL
jgi:protein-S-isoprenylcysteine O-methyltransferase Ste14